MAQLWATPSGVEIRLGRFARYKMIRNGFARYHLTRRHMRYSWVQNGTER